METETIDPAVRAMGEELRLYVQREINAQPDMDHVLAEIIYRTSETRIYGFVRSDFTFWLMVFGDHHYIELIGENVDINNQLKAANLVIGVSPTEVDVIKNRHGDKPTLSLHMADPLYFVKFQKMLVEILA